MGWSYFTIFRPAKDLIGWSLYKPGTLQLQSGMASMNYTPFGYNYL